MQQRNSLSRVEAIVNLDIETQCIGRKCRRLVFSQLYYGSCNFRVGQNQRDLRRSLQLTSNAKNCMSVTERGCKSVSLMYFNCMLQPEAVVIKRLSRIRGLVTRQKMQQRNSLSRVEAIVNLDIETQCIGRKCRRLVFSQLYYGSCNFRVGQNQRDLRRSLQLTSNAKNCMSVTERGCKSVSLMYFNCMLQPEAVVIKRLSRNTTKV